MDPKVSLDQWRAFLAVIDAGGYAKAAEALSKSQSAVSYAVSQLESALGVAVFQLQGRRAVPTEAGEVLARRARHLLREAESLETTAVRCHERVEALVSLAGDMIVPPDIILSCLERFYDTFPDTRVEIFESAMSGTEDALLQRRVELAIAGRVPPGFSGEYLTTVVFRGVTSPDHPLQHLDRPVGYDDLRHYRQSIVMDSGVHRRYSEGWQEAEQRLTVSHIQTSLQAIRRGLSYAWLPEAYLKADLDAGTLKLIPMQTESARVHAIYLVYTDRELAGPATRHLVEVLKAQLGDS
ncbi:LysR family transcriptional regulator [Marinimicrobium sp. ARAG 43.8]|uniref:LysR family transcriptional regulator n=1 Tax=Marinimicrobium sp. ARAG 43.8 TaxID=3418719 RepID=UPI003CED597F